MKLKNQPPKHPPPRDELQIEALKAFNIPLKLIETFGRKSAAEERDISKFEYFHPFGCEVKVPAWIKSGWSAMYAKGLPCRAYIEGAQNPQAAIMVRPDGKHTLGRVLWMYECLINAALFWRWKEGLAVRDRAGRTIWPRIDDDGFPVVDEWEREDGGKTVLRAVDIPLRACGYEEVRDFNKAMGRGLQYAFTYWKWKCDYSLFGAHLGIYMTGEPQLEQIDLPAPAHGRPPSTSHGSAKWGDGTGAKTWLIERG